MGALGVLRPNGDFDLALTIRTVRARRGRDPPVGRRRHRLGLRSRGRDRGVVGQGAAAARRRRRARRRHEAARRRGRGPRASSIPASRSSAPATRRCCAGAPRSRRRASTAGGRSACAEHIERLAASAASLGLTPPDPRRGRARSPRRRSRRPARPDAGLRLYWTGATLVATVAAIPPELEERRARGLRLVSLRARRRARPARLAARPASSRRATRSTWPARPRRAAAAPTTRSSSPTATSCSRRRSRTSGGGAATRCFTPSLEVGVLAGVTRATLLELAPQAGYRVEEGAYAVDRPRAAPTRRSRRRRSARWCRSSSSTARPIGDGAPGDAAARCRRALRARADPSG